MVSKFPGISSNLCYELLLKINVYMKTTSYTRVSQQKLEVGRGGAGGEVSRSNESNIWKGLAHNTIM